MATIGVGNWGSVVQKDLSLIFLKKYKDFKSMLPYIFQFKDAEQGTEYDLETGDIGEFEEFNGEVQYSDWKEGYKKSVTEVEYSKGLKFTRRFLRNDLYGVAEAAVRRLAEAARAKREILGAQVFNNAFTTFTVGDGNPLCYSAHTSKVGGSNQSNTGSLAFSAANLFTVQNYFKKFKTNADQIMWNIPDTIIAPMDLEQDIYEVIKSAGKVDTDFNNRNYLKGRYNAIIWDNFLTSTSAWFLVNSEMMKDHLIFREWEPVQFYRSGEFDTMVLKLAGYFSCAVSTVEWRWVYGNNPS
jgi:phage major head subunit gpT-like protein